jgi:hypothetical protein
VRPRSAHLSLAFTAATVALGLAASAGAAVPAAVTAAACRSLSASQIPVAKLEASYRRLTGLGPRTPLAGSEPRRFGVCGSTHYAFELFTVAMGVKLTYRQQVAQQDHSPVWRQKRDGQWIDEGLDEPCKLAPAALINLWKIGATCKRAVRDGPRSRPDRRPQRGLRLPPRPLSSAGRALPW